MKKKPDVTPQYLVLIGVTNDATGERYEPGEVVALGLAWDIEALLACGAIQTAPPAHITTVEEETDD